ncbi:MAG TPA: hypothetical protein VFS60_11540 [Thermoanaerobaculia bacterium]|nr:hypothetical protein [Thermoanaerobaculia bacterium]
MATKKGKALKPQEFWLRPADLTAMAVAVVEVRRSGTAKTRVASIFNSDGELVVDCRFVGDVSQDIPLVQGQSYQLRFRIRGSAGETWRFHVRSKTTGSNLSSVPRDATGTSTDDAGVAIFTAR